MKKRMAKAGLSKPAKVTYELVPRESSMGEPIYALLDDLLVQHHHDLVANNARIAIAWCTSWKADVDGRVTVGKCKKATALDRELAPVDFVILLNKDVWFNDRILERYPQYRAAVLDHELSHAAVSFDRDGEPRVDAKGRVLFRTRKHDLEEFRDVVAWHGCYRVDIEDFVQAVHRAEAGSQGWIGYTRLAALLERVGLVVEPRTIATWTDTERREVHTFALMRAEAGERVNVTLSQTMPAVLAAAVRPEPPAAAVN